jgi:hypothetical protein
MFEQILLSIQHLAASNAGTSFIDEAAQRRNQLEHILPEKLTFGKKHAQSRANAIIGEQGISGQRHLSLAGCVATVFGERTN